MINFEHCTLFTTSLCNLNCSYCYICKDVNGGLKNIDADIEKDFKEKKYIKQLLDYDPNLSNTITGLTLWGGEPFLKIERFIDQMEDWFENFPYLEKIATSTNFTIPNQTQKIKEMVNKIEKLYFNTNKRFELDIQISIDGYPEMNDEGRGQGVTEQFLNNFRELCNLDYDDTKIYLHVHTKPTLSRDTLHYLNTKEKCKKWFFFFEEEMHSVWRKSGVKWRYENALFNFAQPTEWTKEDGIDVAKVIQNIVDISDEVYQECPGWRPHPSLNPFFIQLACHLDEVGPIFSMEQITQRYQEKRCGGGCGSFVGNIVPIPHGKFTMCHRGLFDEYVDYINNLNSRDDLNGLSEKYFKTSHPEDWLYTPEEMHVVNKMMRPLYEEPNQILYTDMITFIIEYANAGIIDEKYKDMKNAEIALDYFLRRAYCVQDAYLQNGSWVTPPAYEIPLLLNGVMDITLKEFDKLLMKKGWKLD